MFISGALFAASGTYKSSFYLGGISMITSSAIMIYPIIHEFRAKRSATYLVREKRVSARPSEIVALVPSEKNQKIVIERNKVQVELLTENKNACVTAADAKSVDKA